MLRRISLLLVLSMILTACTRGQAPNNTTIDPLESIDATETIVDSEETTTPHESIHSAQTKLNFDPHNIETFVFSEELLDSWLYDLIGQKLNECRKGALYRYHIDTCDLVLVAMGPISEYCYSTKSGYFYTLESSKQSVMRTDLMGQSHNLFYTAEYGDITKLVYCGYPNEGRLYTLEGMSYVMQVDYPERETSVLFYEEGIKNFIISGYPKLEQFYFFKGYDEFWVDLESGETIKAVHP